MSTIGFLSSDLMFHSRVSQSIKDLKSDVGNDESNIATEFKLVVNRSSDKLIEKLLESADTKLVIIDLSLRDLNMESVMKALRDSLPGVPIIAYGPHVAGALLQAAADAGVDTVYTRGQFDHRMTEIISDCIKTS